jgi:hypothetical protein
VAAQKITEAGQAPAFTRRYREHWQCLDCPDGSLELHENWALAHALTNAHIVQLVTTVVLIPRERSL